MEFAAFSMTVGIAEAYLRRIYSDYVGKSGKTFSKMYAKLLTTLLFAALFSVAIASPYEKK
ncbi:6369_t:CDS:2, partial [Acaulospora morrowiae]